MSAPRSASGARLWRNLPEVYRSRDGGDRDERGDLARYLDACGELLDRVRSTLDQRYADCFPESDGPGVRPSQAWLLPYFARLLDARLLSPHVEGRRREVAAAISWRQRKGTLECVEQVAEGISTRSGTNLPDEPVGAEIEAQEGFRRVATTPRLGVPLLSLAAFGVEDPDIERHRPSPVVAARHPGLPAVTVDVRRSSRAVRTARGHPAAQTSAFGGRAPVAWRQVEPHGVPCSPGGYDDVSRRTVDVRRPDLRQGHAHPKRVLIFAAPPRGFFKRLTSARARRRLRAPRRHDYEDEILGRVTVEGGRIRLRGCAVRELIVETTDDQSTLEAEGCLFGDVRVAGRGRLEYCTVVGDASFGTLQASDSIFAGALTTAYAEGARAPGQSERGDVGALPECVRYSRVPAELVESRPLSLHACTADEPVFVRLDSCRGGRPVHGAGNFGEPGCGVLHPAAPRSIRFGAENGGEMGCYHHQRHTLEAAAILEKVAEHLPLGLIPVLIPDPRLHRRPPRLAPPRPPEAR